MNTANHPFASKSAFTAAFREVLGNPEEFTKLKTSDRSEIWKDPDHLHVLCGKLESAFAGSCACGLAHQIGRSAFVHFLRRAQELGDLKDKKFRTLPGKQRLGAIIERLDRLVEEVFGIPVFVIEATDVILSLIHISEPTRPY